VDRSSPVPNDEANFETLRLVFRDGLAVLSLCRPEAGNAINRTLASELMAATSQLRSMPSVRGVLLLGEGKNFCVGGDIRGFAAAGENLAGYLAESTTMFHAAVSHLVRLEVPVVAAVQGNAVGGGLALACCCDLVVAGESARFVVAYSTIGLSPDGSITTMLPRLIGLRRALDVALTNQPIAATDALHWGLVSRVVPDDRLVDEAGVLAASLARGPTKALGAAKRLVRDGWAEGLEVQMQREGATISALADTADAREGIAAFLGKRGPSFTGS
jgi:2-(1,2-epoxy-1,2-dihydrophenyl)acetyl-CoA isomerase